MLESIVNVKKALESKELGEAELVVTENETLSNGEYTKLVTPNDVDTIISDLIRAYGAEYTDNFGHLLATILNSAKGEQALFTPNCRSFVVFHKVEDPHHFAGGIALRYDLYFLDNFREDQLKFPLGGMFRSLGRIWSRAPHPRYESPEGKQIDINLINAPYENLNIMARR